MKRNLRAFTMIETLTVIALISTLAAMTFPILPSVKKPAKGVACTSNLRQIGAALAMYASDYDSLYPYAVDPSTENSQCPGRRKEVGPTLDKAIANYTGDARIWQCPLDHGVSDSHGDFVEGIECDLPGSPPLASKFGMSYAYRGDLGSSRASQPATMVDPDSGIEKGSSEVPIVYDAYGVWHGSTDPSQRRFMSLMADGRVTTLRLDQIAIAESWLPRP